MTTDPVFAVTARRGWRSGTIWGSLFGITAIASASGFATTYPTVAGRLKLAASFANNRGIASLFGPAIRIDTVAGFTSWRSLILINLIGAIWALLFATRSLRGEEDEGRWELLLAGVTTQQRAVLQALLAFGVTLLTTWACIAICIVPDGLTSKVNFTVSASLYYATALLAAPALFFAIGALTSQLAPTRRRANMIGAAVLAVSFALRMVADAVGSLGWLRWTSPLGWIEQLRPLTGSHWVALLPVLTLATVCAGVAIALAGRRDLAGSILPSRDTASPRIRLLGDPFGLAVRLTRSTIVAWVVGVAIGGFLIGTIAKSAATALTASPSVSKALARLGGYRIGAGSYLGFVFLFLAALAGVAAAGQVGAIRAEEAGSMLEHLLARPVGRARWLAGRVVIATVLLLLIGVALGVACWLGAATQDSGLGLATMLAAGLNLVPAALFALAAGVLVFGVAPRWATGATYAIIAWSVVVEVVLAAVSTSHWLPDTSLYFHVKPAPATNPDWSTLGVLVLLAVLGVAGGVAAFAHRDVVAQ